MIQMGESISYGSDSEIMRQAADALDAKVAEIARLREAIEKQAKVAKYALSFDLHDDGGFMRGEGLEQINNIASKALEEDS